LGTAMGHPHVLELNEMRIIPSVREADSAAAGHLFRIFWAAENEMELAVCATAQMMYKSAIFDF
jgi:hypothetical protein